MTLYIGIDPGKRGALAFVSDAGEALQAIAMPLVKAGKGGRDEFDLPLIRDILEHNRREQPRFVTIEKLHPMPPHMGGSVANFARGESRVLVGILVGLRVPYPRWTLQNRPPRGRAKPATTRIAAETR